LTTKISKTKIDQLGDRLRKDRITEADLTLLDAYRLSFGEAYETVVRTIRKKFKLVPTGRPAKSTTSIREKLLRESIRLTQIQDIAGCRIVVPDIEKQDQVVDSLHENFPEATLVDRRQKPSYGYRAVHVIPEINGKLIEIQIRTSLQHLWAELSEKVSDVIDSAIKYGGGPDNVKEPLMEMSEIIFENEFKEKKAKSLRRKFLNLKEIPPDLKSELNGLDKKASNAKHNVMKSLSEIISGFEKIRKKTDDFSN
jgi:ppGpp synthetase/RelA/SpoT-type nucleotidyltranferase